MEKPQGGAEQAGVSRTGRLGVPSSLPALTAPKPALSEAVYSDLAKGRSEEED